jgi:hypothetical protein
MKLLFPPRFPIFNSIQKFFFLSGNFTCGWRARPGSDPISAVLVRFDQTRILPIILMSQILYSILLG